MKGAQKTLHTYLRPFFIVFSPIPMGAQGIEGEKHQPGFGGCVNIWVTSEDALE